MVFVVVVAAAVVPFGVGDDKGMVVVCLEARVDVG